MSGVIPARRWLYVSGAARLCPRVPTGGAGKAAGGSGGGAVPPPLRHNVPMTKDILSSDRTGGADSLRDHTA